MKITTYQASRKIEEAASEWKNVTCQSLSNLASELGGISIAADADVYETFDETLEFIERHVTKDTHILKMCMIEEDDEEDNEIHYFAGSPTEILKKIKESTKEHLEFILNP